MKIVDKRNKEVRFDSVDVGAVFTAGSGEHVWMRIESTYSDDNGDYDNVVYLVDGQLGYFKDDTMVTLVESELVIG